MDFQYSSLLIAASGLVIGSALCWLALRGRIAAAALEARSAARSLVQAELLKVQKRVRSLDEECLVAVENFDKLNLQATQWREALDIARVEKVQLAERAAQVEILEGKLIALQEREKESQQELQLLSTSDAESVEALKRVSAQLAQLEDEDSAQARNRDKVPVVAQDPGKQSATANAQASQLPVLETEVIALQDLAKKIRQEFQVLLEVQRNFTAASSALQDVS